MIQKKILVVLVVIILVISGLAAIFYYYIINNKMPVDYTPPFFHTSDEVDEYGLLVDVDYDEIESNLKTYDYDNDLDDDNLSDSYEKELGFDPYTKDADGDGLYDEDEKSYGCDPFNFDSDSDGLSDGEEVYNFSTNPALQDTDGDLLFDGEEVFAGTDPLDSDSDNEGLIDGMEINWDEDTDLDGHINALDKDSDGDGLDDKKEFNFYFTDMLIKDTDSDGINDYYEAVVYHTDPNDPDTDDDDLIDSKEAYDGILIEAEDFLSEGAYSENIDDKKVALPSQDTGDIVEISRDLNLGKYKIMFFSKITSFDSSKNQKPKIQLDMSGGISNSEIIYLPVVLNSLGSIDSEFRWFSSQPFELDGNQEINFDFNMIDYLADESIAIDKIFIVKLDVLNKSFTNPNDPDTDDDGIIDGKEAAEDAFWFEAEDFATNEEYILNEYNSSNGKVVSTTHLALVDPTTLISINTNSEIPKGFYSLFIRGYSSWWSILDVSITYIDSDGSSQTISGKYEMDGFFERGLWVSVYYNGDSENLKFELPNPSNIIIEIKTTELSKSDPLSIDKISFVKMTYKKPTSAFASQLPGLVPRLLTDPLDPDTDGDQYRKEIGHDNGEDCDTCASMLSIIGYLTDDFELKNGMNPMSLDSDSDLIPDDIDPNPLGQDADDDGIPDFFEDIYPEDMPDGVYQPDEENTNWCDPDTDRDRVIDGNEDWDYDTIVDDGETDPNNPDTDGDGLLDGGSSVSPVLLEDSNHDYTTTLGSAQYEYLSSRLNKINDSGTYYDPWIVNGNSITFYGELDKGTDPNEIDSDNDLIEDGVEVFVYNTNPTKIDTDGDSYTDYQEIYEMGTDPLVADWPDLTVKSISMNPETPELDWWNETRTGLFTVEIENIGVVDAIGKIEIQMISNNKIVKKTVRDVGKGQVKEVEFDYEAVADEYYQDYFDCYPWTIIYKPGKFEAKVKIETENPESWYGEKVRESTHTNNEKSYNVTIKGAAPEAFLKTNYNLNLINAGENITLEYSGKDVDGTITKYEIDFEGDGVYDFTDNVNGWINHTYEKTSYNGTERGTFTAILRVTDDDNKTDTCDSKEIIVLPSLEDDSDGDGLTNEEEIYTYGTNIYDADFDQDGLNDYQELIEYKTNPFKSDSDGDGIRDDREIIVAGFYGLKGTDDADGDGLPNIIDADSDNDGIKDGTELKFIRPDTLEPISIQVQYPECWHGTNPYNQDTDFDGISDVAEEGVYIRGVNGRPHLDLNSKKADTDGDNLNDYEEVYVFGTAANEQDSDKDGLEDGIDLQPMTGVISMNTIEEDFSHFAYATPYRYQNGINWTKFFPKHMLKFITRVQLCGIDGNSWDTWGEDEDLGNEGVMDSDIGPDSLWGLGYGDFEVFDYDLPGGRDDTYILPYATTTYTGRFNIVYQLKGKNYDIHLWNNKLTKDPNSFYYTAWEIGLEKGYNNSIEMQFKIIESRDKYDISDEDNFYIPAFSYKLYKKGNDGLEISENNGLTWHGDPVFEGIAQATEIKDKKHWYQAELRINKNNISSEKMFIVISPIWQKPDNVDYMNPKILRFASLSKLVYYDDVNEKMRVGCRIFNDLSKSITKPTSWDGVIYNNYTSVRKKDENLYQVTEVKSVKKVKKHEDRWDLFSPHTVLEKLIYSKNYEVSSVDDFTGEIRRDIYDNVKSKLSDAAPDSIFATDYKIAVIKFSIEDNFISNERKWCLTSPTGEFASSKLAPKAMEGISHASFKATAAFAVVFGTADIVVSGYKYANTNNPILERQYGEEMWAAGINIGLNLIPYYFFVELGVKVIVYAVEYTVGWPDDVNIKTLADPGALIVFAVEYLITGDVPSDLAKKALRDACNIQMDNVNRMNLLRQEGEKFHVFIPPS